MTKQTNNNAKKVSSKVAKEKVLKEQIEAKKAIADAKILLEQEIKNKVSACGKKVDEILKEYNCEIEPAILVTPRGNQPQMTIRYKGDKDN